MNLTKLNMLKMGLVVGLLTLLIGLTACGYPTPPNGGGLTPFVTVVTPTPLPGTSTANADATVLARATLTPLPLTFAAPRPTTANAPSNPGQPNQPNPAANQPSPTPTLALQGDQYTVQQGDTLLGIAIRFNVDFDELASVNNIADRNSIKVGQKLVIPKRKVGTPGPSTTP